MINFDGKEFAWLSLHYGQLLYFSGYKK